MSNKTVEVIHKNYVSRVITINWPSRDSHILSENEMSNLYLFAYFINPSYLNESISRIYVQDYLFQLKMSKTKKEKTVKID